MRLNIVKKSIIFDIGYVSKWTYRSIKHCKKKENTACATGRKIWKDSGDESRSIKKSVKSTNAPSNPDCHFFFFDQPRLPRIVVVQQDCYFCLIVIKFVTPYCKVSRHHMHNAISHSACSNIFKSIRTLGKLILIITVQKKP